MDARLKAASQRVDDSFVPKTYDGAFWLETRPSKRKVIVSLEEGEIVSGQFKLQYPRLDVENTAHIGLFGPNGSGKSTLLRELLRQVPSDIPTLYIPQELDTNESGRLLASLKELEQKERGAELSLVAGLNSAPDRILSGDSLSPGELRKIMLAMGILQSPQLIIMDEPTNHLDLQSAEALEAVLANCPCALLLVSHDARLLTATTDQRWEFKGGWVHERLRA
jgi:ATPase subunit of ABC transporter with duplicated ATPase domains